MFDAAMNLITTVIGFGMSATFIVFVCTRIICGRLRGAESSQMFEIESRIDVEQPEHGINGLEPVLVAAIPTLRFTREAFSSADDAHVPADILCIPTRLKNCFLQQVFDLFRGIPGKGSAEDHAQMWPQLSPHLNRRVAKKTLYMPGLSVLNTRLFRSKAHETACSFYGPIS